MAPELLRGVKSPDTSSDIYSLGLTFYEMLTGRVPFADWSRSGALDVRRLRGEAEAVSLTQIRPDVPPQLALVLAKAIKRNPKKRYASAAEFLRALQECESQFNASELTSRLDSRLDPRVDSLKVAFKSGAPGEVVPPQLLPPASPQIQQALQAVPTPVVPAVRPQLLPPERLSSNHPARLEPLRRNPATFANQPTSALPRAIPVNVAPPPYADISKSRREWWLIPVTMASVLIGTLTGAYFFSSPRTNEGRASKMLPREATQSSLTPAPMSAPEPQESLPATSASRGLLPPQPMAKPIVSVPDTPTLNLARQAEKQERYSEAIRAYEEVLVAYPAAPFAAVARLRVATLRRFQGALAQAHTALAEARFGEAQQRYAEALKLRPGSNQAQTGWREAGARLNSARTNPLHTPAAVQPETQKEPAREIKGEVRGDLREAGAEKLSDSLSRPRTSVPKPTPTPQP